MRNDECHMKFSIYVILCFSFFFFTLTFLNGFVFNTLNCFFDSLRQTFNEKKKKRYKWTLLLWSFWSHENQRIEIKKNSTHFLLIKNTLLNGRKLKCSLIFCLWNFILWDKKNKIKCVFGQRIFNSRKFGSKKLLHYHFVTLFNNLCSFLSLNWQMENPWL